MSNAISTAELSTPVGPFPVEHDFGLPSALLLAHTTELAALVHRLHPQSPLKFLASQAR